MCALSGKAVPEMIYYVFIEWDVKPLLTHCFIMWMTVCNYWICLTDGDFTHGYSELLAPLADTEEDTEESEWEHEQPELCVAGLKRSGSMTNFFKLPGITMLQLLTVT